MMPTKTCIPWRYKTQHFSLLPPQTQQLYDTEALYLPGYTTKGAVLRIIEETHNTKLTAHKYFFWNGMCEGNTRSNGTNKSFIDKRSNEMNIKIFHKPDTPDWKPDTFKTSAVDLIAQVHWNE